jgi:DNA-binding NarL/FixJ family response regulator
METERILTVALADDHSMVRTGIEAIVSSFGGFSVVASVENGVQLVRALGMMDKLPDMCVIDINMPEQNGYETLDILRERFPSVKALMLTMYDNEFSIIKAFSKGAKGYVLKESDPLELRDALWLVYEGEIYHPEVISNRRLFQQLHAASLHGTRRISEKEMLFLPYCCTELSLKEIAVKMGVSTRTVQGYRDSLFDKLSLKTRTGLAIYAITAGLVPVR